MQQVPYHHHCRHHHHHRRQRHIHVHGEERHRRQACAYCSPSRRAVILASAGAVQSGPGPGPAGWLAHPHPLHLQAATTLWRVAGRRELLQRRSCRVPVPRPSCSERGPEGRGLHDALRGTGDDGGTAGRPGCHGGRGGRGAGRDVAGAGGGARAKGKSVRRAPERRGERAKPSHEHPKGAAARDSRDGSTSPSSRLARFGPGGFLLVPLSFPRDLLTSPTGPSRSATA